MTHPALPKLAAAAALAMGAVCIGGFLSADSQLMLLLGLAAIGCAVAAVGIQLRNSWLGFGALIVVSVALPLEFGGTAERAPLGAAFLLGLVICALWICDWIVLRRHIPRAPRRVAFAAAVFVAITVVAFVAGQRPAFRAAHAAMSAQVMQLLLFGGSVGLFFAVGRLVQGVEHLRRLTWLFLAAGGMTCLIIVLASYDFFDGLGFGILNDLLDTRSIGSLFWLWLVAISLSQAVFNKSLSLPARWACAGITGLTLFRGLVLAPSWVSGWLPPLVATLVILVLRFPRTLILGGMIAGLFWLLIFPPTTAMYVPTGEEYSALTRAEAARTLWALALGSPLLGYGPANYYRYSLLTPVLGWYVSYNSHNAYLDLLLQVGFLGTAAFAWLLCETLLVAVRCARVFRRSFPHAYAIGVLAGIAGTVVSGLLADWIIPFVYNIGVQGFRSSLFFWFFSGGLLVLYRARQIGAGDAALT